MARKTKASVHNDILAQARKEFDKAVTAEDANRILSREDRRFGAISGEQWDQRFNHDSTKPRFEVNRIHHSISQVVGEYTRNQIMTKVRPNNGDASVSVANTYDGLMRNIYAESHFNHTQAESFKEVCLAGFSAWRVINEYIDGESFEQGIKIEGIRDAINSVWFDSSDKDSLKRNGRYCFITIDMDRDEYKEMYPDSAMNSWEKLSDSDTLLRGAWATVDSIRVAEYYKKTEKTKSIVKMSNGMIYDFNDVKDILDELANPPVDPQTNQPIQPPLTVEDQRKVKFDEITWHKMNGTEILEGPIVIDSKYIPVVPVYGYNSWIDQSHIFYGMVRPAKDSQRLYNYAISAAVEAAANSPLDPIFITATQVAGYEDDYANANVRNTPFLFYNGEEGENMPFRLGAPVVQQALIEQASRAERDIQATLGRNDASLGEIPQNGGSIASGKALAGAQKQSNLGQEELFSNMGNAVEYTGEILVDLIPKVYSNEQQLRILKQDGTTEFVPINQEQQDMQTGETHTFNDLNQGRYDVEVTLSPSFETQRAETLAMLTALAQDNPAFLTSTADILAKSMDFPEAEEISKRMRKQMLLQGLVEPNEDEQKEMAEDEQRKQEQGPTVEERITLESLKLDLETKAANVDYLSSQILQTQASAQKSLADADKSEMESVTKLMDSMTKAFAAGMKEQAETMQLLQDQIIDANNNLSDKLPEQINAAFSTLQPGVYQAENGEIFDVDGQGNIQASQMPQPGPQ